MDCMSIIGYEILMNNKLCFKKHYFKKEVGNWVLARLQLHFSWFSFSIYNQTGSQITFPYILHLLLIRICLPGKIDDRMKPPNSQPMYLLLSPILHFFLQPTCSWWSQNSFLSPFIPLCPQTHCLIFIQAFCIHPGIVNDNDYLRMNQEWGN